jgi:hypothetical protein
MSRRRFGSSGQRGLWSGLGPTPRLIAGALIVVLIGLLGMTPKSVYGLLIPWPYAALWGAVGWGRVGLSTRPMLLLIAFGFAQDFGFHTPLGCFALVNLIIYGLSSAIADNLDVRDPLVALVGPTILFFVAFILIWIMASLLGNHVVAMLPLLTPILFTGALYGLAHTAFDLGRKPGQIMGRA